MIRYCLCMLATTVLLALEAVPIDPAACIVQAEAPAVVRFRMQAGSEAAWSLRDWDGRQLAAGTAMADGEGILGIPMQVPAGWHELSIGASAFGILAQDAMPVGEPDPFFAIDAAMSWLVKDDARREVLVRQLRSLGIAEVRERLAWWAVQPAPDRFNAQTPFRDDALRALYAGAGIRVLDAFHDAPAWMGRVAGVYPSDMLAVASAWRTIAERFSASTAAIEVWNEPDAAEFAGDGTPDQLVALTRAVAWAVRQQHPGIRICGGAFTRHATASYRSASWANGLLGACDVFTYHDYAAPDRLEGHLQILRQEMADAGDPSVPIWITEAGKAWPSGSGRPDATDDARSAHWITLRAVEARACGVQRYYAFVLPYYPEGRNNFSMTGRDGTALRSLAAYGHLARRLAGLPYAGDLAVPGAQRTRLFADAQRAVAVVWLGEPGEAQRLRTDLPVRACFGLDGRRILRGADGTWETRDGACYFDLDPAVRVAAVTGTIAMELWRQAQQGRPRPTPSPIVLQCMPTPGDIGSRLDHYALVPQPGGVNTMRVRIANCAAQPAEVRLALRAPPGGRIRDGADRALALAGQSAAEVAWLIEAPGGGTWSVAVETDGSVLPPLVIELRREIDGAALLERIPPEHQRRITARELLDVDGNIGAGNSMTPGELDDGTWRLALDFAKADRWAFPRLTLPADARFGHYDAILVQARCRDPAAVRLIVFEGGSANLGYISKEPIIAADGAWHWSLIRLSDLERGGFSDPDPNGRLDPEQIERLSIGLNSQTKQNVLEIRRLVLVRAPPAGEAGP